MRIPTTPKYPYLRDGLFRRLATGVFLLSFIWGCNPGDVNEEDASETKIIGGLEITDPNDETAVATVALMVTGQQPHCTATIVGPNHLVTAAHCLRDWQDNGFYSMGAGLNAAPVQGITMMYARTHPGFNKAQTGVMRNDIAVITFTGQLPAPLQPVQIAPMTIQADPSGTSCTTDVLRGDEWGSCLMLAGFGVMNDQMQGNGVLRGTYTPLGSLDPANKEFSLYDGDGRGSCSGDSGGPAFARVRGQLTLIGALSRGPRLCAGGNGIYSDVRAHLGWINESFNAMQAPINLLPFDPNTPAPPPATDPNVPPATDPNVPPATDPNAPPVTDPSTDPATDPAVTDPNRVIELDDIFNGEAGKS